MMFAARTVPLLVAFCLLTSAATASAECAWVLWTDVMSFQSGATGGWTIDSAWPREAECRTRLREEIQLAKRATKLETVTYEDHYTVVDQSGHPLQTVRYLCLPDTVDPRGPNAR